MIDEIRKELSSPAHQFTLAVVAKLCNQLIKDCQYTSETTFGEQDLLLKGEIKAYRKIISILVKSH